MAYCLASWQKILIWVRSWRCSRLVTWFCYHLIAKPGNKTGTPSWPDSYVCIYIEIPLKFVAKDLIHSKSALVEVMFWRILTVLKQQCTACKCCLTLQSSHVRVFILTLRRTHGTRPRQVGGCNQRRTSCKYLTGRIRQSDWLKSLARKAKVTAI